MMFEDLGCCDDDIDPQTKDLQECCTNLSLNSLVIDHESLGYKVWGTFIYFLCIVSSFIYANFATMYISKPEIQFEEGHPKTW